MKEEKSNPILYTGLPILLVGIIIFSVLFVSFLSGLTPYDDYGCSVCEWNYVHSELLDYDDPGYGHAGALQAIWDSANYGKQVNLVWYENYRLKYDLTSVDSFNLINYSNSRPSSPSIKHMDTGNITYVAFSHDVGYPKLVYVNPIINGTKYYWHMWEIGETLPSNWKDGDPFPFNYSHTYFVYKQKYNAWHWQHKDAIIIDGNENPEHLDNTLSEWNQYNIDYQNYLDNGGVDKGDDYWM